MKKEPLFQLRYQHQLVFTPILLISAMIILACNNQKSESKDWLNMKVRFKKNTTESIRQASLNAIEREVLDTVTQLHNKNKDFNPFISRIRNSISDSLNYTIKVTSQATDTLPECTCKTVCKPCRIIDYPRVVPLSTSEFVITDYIEMIDTDQDNLNRDPGKK